MKAVVLAGGYGGARFARGLRDHLTAESSGAPDHDVTVIVNTADDIRLHGLHISPDLDTVMYTLGGGLDEERGWGRRDEAFRVSEDLAAYSTGSAWFGLGDRDLATHLIRTQMREAGYPLTQVTEALCERWQPGVNLLPMTDNRVETHVVVDLDGQDQAIHFQEWWIRYRAELPARSFVQVGIAEATLTPAVRSAIAAADIIIVAPSNPVVSIEPILAVPGMRDAIQGAHAPVVGVSPIIAGSPLRGMADKCLDTIGVPSTSLGVAANYSARSDSGLLDAWVIDEQDSHLVSDVTALGITCRAVPTVMHDSASAMSLAAETLSLSSLSVETQEPVSVETQESVSVKTQESCAGRYPGPPR